MEDIFETFSSGHCLGGMEAALQLWEACCMPSLLHGAGTWVEMTKATELKLNKIQNWFVRLVLQVGPGAPLAGLLWDARLLDMGLRVWREKIMLMLHIRRLDESTLAHRMYREQRANAWPGLAQETQSICEQLEVEEHTHAHHSQPEVLPKWLIFLKC